MSSQQKDNNWAMSSLPAIEKRSVNKELETRKVLINFILLLLLKLVENFTKLILLKLDSKLIDFDNDSTVWYLRTILNLLFVYNIANGIYNILKPNDEFKDLKLTNEQRTLLGLPIIQQDIMQDSKQDSIKLQKIEPRVFTTQHSNITLSPKRPGVPPTKIADTVNSLNKNNISPINKVTALSNPPKTATKLATPSKNKTPIASPMSSPSPIRPFFKSTINKPSSSSSNLKPSSISSTSSKLINKNLTNPVFQNSGVFTPTYIPSPKYYYRMDSPTKTRRI